MSRASADSVFLRLTLESAGFAADENASTPVFSEIGSDGGSDGSEGPLSPFGVAGRGTVIIGSIGSIDPRIAEEKQSSRSVVRVGAGARLRGEATSAPVARAAPEPRSAAFGSCDASPPGSASPCGPKR